MEAEKQVLHRFNKRHQRANNNAVNRDRTYYNDLIAASEAGLKRNYRSRDNRLDELEYYMLIERHSTPHNIKGENHKDAIRKGSTI